ncbi:hypothetical protein BJ508DRAFT_417525 [Ascobolus immersus RN42]|uniref:RRM domain-containing protein n=1 Tax=Ascobolus immersus RN42 TaxID=1160509 RepID=A0A3N4HRY9_ASCIM|nr:hypothetical protein BJ508DRAFT_417525 [Ascobolus immersus RN42]
MQLPQPPSALPALPSNYIALPISYPPTASFPESTTHVLYLRPHTPVITTSDTPKSIFAANLPPDTTTEILRGVLSTSKLREILWLDDIKGGVQKSGSSAVLVFEDEESARRVLKKAAKGKAAAWGEGVEDGLQKRGLKHYKQAYISAHPPMHLIEEAINTSLAAFAEAEAAEAEARHNRSQQVDEDGFVLVTRGAKVKDAEELEQEMSEKKKRKRDHTMAGTPFYRFQVRQGRKEEAKRLVEKWEEDKRRLEERKARRRLRPL